MLLQYTFLSGLSKQIELKLKNQMDYLWFHDYSCNAIQTKYGVPLVVEYLIIATA